MADENELFAEWQKASPEAKPDIETKLAAAVQRHAQAIFQQTIDEPQLDDLVLFIVTAVITQLSKFRGDSKFSTWVQAISKRKANEYLRTKIRERDRGEHLPIDGENEDDGHDPGWGEPARQENQVI